MTESFEAMKTTGLNTIGITNDDKNTESEQWAAKMKFGELFLYKERRKR